MCASVRATSSPSRASCAPRRKAEDARDKAAEEVVQTVLQDFYIDDYLNSVSSENHAVLSVKQLRNRCKQTFYQETI